MSDAVFQRSRTSIVGVSPAPRLPVGYSLVLGAVASTGLWLAIFWLLGLVFG